jgi:hypothetical protein
LSEAAGMSGRLPEHSDPREENNRQDHNYQSRTCQVIK